jgi:hypothetical protein
MDFIHELQQVIDAKNARYETYLDYCDECWLLIVANGGRPSGLFESSDKTKSRVYHSLFERTFFLEAFDSLLLELMTTSIR